MILDDYEEKITCNVCDEKFIVETESGVSAGFCPVCGSELEIESSMDEEYFYIDDEEDTIDEDS